MQKQPREGDLFGVQAIEHGSYGGVAQSRPSSPAPSYILAPQAKLVDWGKVGSSASSLNERSRNGSVSSLPRSINNIAPAMIKPSPLSLMATDEEIRRARNTPNAVDGRGGASMLPPPSSPVPSLFGEPKPAGWVSPLDVHFSKTTTQKAWRPTSYLPRLNLLGDDFGQNGLLMPEFDYIKSEAASIVSTEISVPPMATLDSPYVKSPDFSFFPQQTPQQADQNYSADRATEPAQTTQPPIPSIPSRAARGASRSIFPATEERDSRKSVRKSKSNKFENFEFGLQTVQLDDLPPRIATTNTNSFPQDNRKWSPTTLSIPKNSFSSRKEQPSSPITRDNSYTTRWGLASPSLINSMARDARGPPSPGIPDSVLDAQWESSKPVIRDSVVSIQRVSVYQLPQHPTSKDVLSTPRLSRTRSIAASSRYSTETFSIDVEVGAAHHARIQSQAADIQSYSEDTRGSGSRKRHSPSQNLSRTRNSIRQHNRKLSEESLITSRRDRQRDQIHYDPTQQHRNRSGSVQGRKVDFDHPRESPFSNSNATSDHSSSSSISSYMSSTESPDLSSSTASMAKTQPKVPDLDDMFPVPPVPARIRPKPHGLEVSTFDSGRLSVASGRERSGSDVSQASMGSFYDSYYRQSTLATPPVAKRISVQEKVQEMNARGKGNGHAIGDILPRRQPPPAPLNLKLGPGSAVTGRTMSVNNNFATVPFPLATPKIDSTGFAERFPTRI